MYVDRRNDFTFIFFQLSMSVLANFSILSSGMGLGFPAITYQSLTDKTDPMALTNEQASWFGELLSHSILNFLFFLLHFHLLQHKIHNFPIKRNDGESILSYISYKDKENHKQTVFKRFRLTRRICLQKIENPLQCKHASFPVVVLRSSSMRTRDFLHNKSKTHD